MQTYKAMSYFVPECDYVTFRYMLSQIRLSFLPERDRYVRVFAVAVLSVVCRLSVRLFLCLPIVCNVRAPYSHG